MSHSIEFSQEAPSLEQALELVKQHCPDATLSSGESVILHAEAVVHILEQLHIDTSTKIAATLLFAVPHINTDVERLLSAHFGKEIFDLVMHAQKLVQLSSMGGSSLESTQHENRKAHVEALRKMLLAFARDIRIVLIHLASCLQSLRFYAAQKISAPSSISSQVLEIYAPLANRLGIWQIKWELEDLAFRFEQPDIYKRIANLLDEKRTERETFIANVIHQLKKELNEAGIQADISGRPKHIYSIWQKMRGKELDFAELYDVRAFRIIVASIKDCYTVLGFVHHLWQPIPKEFDDYISRPKPNGYQSLHTAVMDEAHRAFEIQIRTQDMHQFAEYGIAAHWRYKEAGKKGYSGNVSANEVYDTKIAWLRQLLAWKEDVSHEDTTHWENIKQIQLDDHIYVLTPQAQIIALPQEATPIDFAYHLHTELGHRCRGARVDGAMVPLNTALKNGQTVEIIAVKQGGPSRDWLNPQLAYINSNRTRQKVRAWFNAIELENTIAQGRSIIEKILQREGKTAINLEDLATQLNFKTAEDLFASAGKDELNAKDISKALTSDKTQTPTLPEGPAALASLLHKNKSKETFSASSNGVLVEGMGTLLTQLAGCCKPAPPDDIMGFVTQGKGVSIHRKHCTNFLNLQTRMPERVIQTSWSQQSLEGSHTGHYAIDIQIKAQDRPGLLHDISEVLAREKIKISQIQMRTDHHHAFIHLTVVVQGADQVQQTIRHIESLSGVITVQRK